MARRVLRDRSIEFPTVLRLYKVVKVINKSQKIHSPSSKILHYLADRIGDRNSRIFNIDQRLSGICLSADRYLASHRLELGNPVCCFVCRPVFFEMDKGLEIGLQQKGIGFPFAPDCRFRRHAVIVAWKNTGCIRQGQQFFVQ